MKKILYFMPDNPHNSDAGNKTRIITFLNYFNQRGFEVDFISEKKWGEWTEKSASDFLASGLIKNLYLVERKPPRKQFFNYLYTKAINIIYNRIRKIDTKGLTNQATYYLCNAVHEIVKDKKYDFVIINYVTWANMIADRSFFPSAKIAINTHDFMTSHCQKKKGGKYIGNAFKEEMRRLNLFDEIWVESTDEHYIYSQFCTNTIRWVPFMLPNNLPNNAANKKYDVIYVASDNPQNIAAAQWFMRDVYPFLSTQVKICVIGKITYYIEDKENIEKVPFAPSLDSYYSEAKVVICPMLRGTGIKVKVVEAFSFGLPIVCNERGVDGLPNKTENGCIVTNDAKTFAESIHQLLSDETLYKKYHEQSQNMFLANFSNERCYKQLDAIFEV